MDGVYRDAGCVGPVRPQAQYRLGDRAGYPCYRKA